MGLIEKHILLQKLAPPLDALLASQLLDEFISMERRFIQRDWEPSELDGGQFCEVLARILYHIDSGTLNLSKDFGECLNYIENDGAVHAFAPRKDFLHLSRVLRVIYKFRSDRGAVHISPSYGPNQMDAKYLIESVRWSMNEILRVFWNGDREIVAKTIRELLRFDVPSIGRFEDALLVQRTDLTPEEEVLLLLHYGGEQGFTRTELGQYAKVSASSVTRALQTLISPDNREIVLLSNKHYVLTDLGNKRVREKLSDKLLLQ